MHTIKDKIAEIKVHVPRHAFFVKQSSKSFEESFDTALDSVINQIKRKKRKTGRVIKKNNENKGPLKWRAFLFYLYTFWKQV